MHPQAVKEEDRERTFTLPSSVLYGSFTAYRLIRFKRVCVVSCYSVSVINKTC